jgi:hypothetical protein
VRSPTPKERGEGVRGGYIVHPSPEGWQKQASKSQHSVSVVTISVAQSREVIEIVRQALDDGITFYDNAWEYYHGKTESWLAWASKAGVTKPLS